MLPNEILRLMKIGQSIKAGPYLPKVTPEVLRMTAVAIDEELDGGLTIKFQKTYFGVYCGDAQVTIDSKGASKWHL